MATYQNPLNGYETTDGGAIAWLWCLLFGSFYFAFRRNWTHALISLVAAVLTSGISWFIYPFFARALNRHDLQMKGWKVAA